MPTKKKKFIKPKHNIIAIVYDFDETLTPLPMQDYTILPEIGITKGKKFWEESNRINAEIKGDQIITYMRLIIQKAKEKQISLKHADFRKLGARIKYYKGVPTFFERINKWLKRHYGRNVKLEHYIVSAGLKEILDGIVIRKHFKKIYASQYYYDYFYPKNNRLEGASFPKVIVNDTIKTQFLFRINKGVLEYKDSINTHMSPDARRIPFTNMLYIGDGLSDVPCMAVTKKEGGRSIAVYQKKHRKALDKCRSLMVAERVDFAVTADYTANSELDKAVKAILTAMASRILLEGNARKQNRKFA